MCSVHPTQPLPYRPDSEIRMRNVEEGTEVERKGNTISECYSY